MDFVATALHKYRMEKKPPQSNSAEQLQTALQMARIGVCEYALPPTPYVHVNETWAAILGYVPREIPIAPIFLSWWGQQIHPDDHQRVVSSFNRLYSGQDERLMCQLRLRHKKGDWREVELVAKSLQRDEKGWARRVLVVMRELGLRDNRYRQIVENLHEGLWLMDRNHRISYVNQTLCDMLGYAQDEMMGHDVAEFQSQPVSRSREKLESEGKQGVFDTVLRHKDGSVMEVRVLSAAMQDAQGRFEGVVEGIIDIAEQKARELRLKILSNAVEQSGSMVMITDQLGNIEYVNSSFCGITGYGPDDVLGKNARILRPEDADMELISDMWATVSGGKDWHGEWRNMKKDGSFYWSSVSVSPIINESGQISHYVSVSEDITEQKATQFKMEQLAYVDSLTGLANRILFRDRLEQALKNIQRKQSRAALLYLDLDQFKRINDSLGHDVGDALLMQVAERLRNCVRHQDTVARMGGDEFVILLTDVDGMAGASAVARKILETMRHSHKLLRHEIIITPSIGITLAPDDSLNADILLKNADLAMYRAKSQGRNNFQFFTEEMNTRVLDQLLMENELRQAIASEELRLQFQPQVDLQYGKLVGVEALVRWQHPQKGLLGPDKFVPVAEETGLIVPLGEWVLRNACREWHMMEKIGLGSVRLAVNLSARQFRDPDLIDMIQKILDITGFKPIQLELEITETILMENIEHAIETLGRIKALGISITIDDFGTGYSSLNYLKRLPLDALKIDKSFITDIPQSKDDMAIAAAVIAMAHKLKLKVVAEGVQNEAQRAFLLSNQCDIAQGYMIGKPMEAKEFMEKWKPGKQG
jgi:diguanylate cyclase (GGDEF)-like protein/PAS domain S-box-containing protein